MKHRFNNVPGYHEVTVGEVLCETSPVLLTNETDLLHQIR